MRAESWRWVLRTAFFLYAVVLFGATHWPALRIEGSGRPDLIVHLAAFGLWTLALNLAGFWGPRFSVRNVLISGAVAVMYAAFDEGTQAIPALQRTAAWDDYLANVSGIVLASLTCLGAGAFIGLTKNRASGVHDGN
ncbi:MAG: hypothetical protein KF678_00700 [Phycisphaeraceae bacterium]|nr:hypothetical protein [Phycisphaeraceae bacterium]